VELEQLAQLVGKADGIEQVLQGMARRATLSSYAGPMPRPVVPIFFSPFAASRAASRALW